MNDLYVNCNRCIYALMIWICKLNRIDTRHKICILHVWNWAFPTVTFPGKIFYKLLLFFLLLLLFIAINVIICYYCYIFDICKHYFSKRDTPCDDVTSLQMSMRSDCNGIQPGSLVLRTECMFGILSIRF